MHNNLLKMNTKLWIYKTLCLFRIALVFFPQSGYIHPDEYFQGPETVYGDIAKYNVLRTWEFSTSKPIRSILFPYSVAVLPALITQLLEWQQYKVDAYLLLILPRLLMCLLSFVQDFCIYKTCIAMGTKYESGLIVFASSYVTFVYLTRTFSNSLESLLFALFLFLFFNCLRLLENCTEGKIGGALSQLAFCNFMSGVTLSLGCFVRPTFFCFAIVPIIILHLRFFTLYNHRKITLISFLFGALSMTICAIAIDSFYYNKINYSSINNFKVVCTPINFLFYNLNSSNLRTHGLHPRWLHLLINVPLLFSVYGAILPFYFIKKCFQALSELKLNWEFILLLSFFTPLILLSLIPHQEPRFLIPLIIPFSLLYSFPPLKNYLSNKFCICLWISSNLLCLFLYGFIHQAGVYLSINYLNREVRNNSCIIFYKTYMPPRHLFSLTERHNNVGVYDLAGLNSNEFENEINNVINNRHKRAFIVLPYKIFDSDITFEALTISGFKFVERIHLFPHLSTENLPKLTSLYKILNNKSPPLYKLLELEEIFSIHVIKFERGFS